MRPQMILGEVDKQGFYVHSLKLTERLNYMAKTSEIVLLRDSYALQDITSSESRERLGQTLLELDQRQLTELELRRYFEGLRLAMGAFIQRVSLLEMNIRDLKRDQLAAESRMEAMCLKAQLEIQELRAEITEVRLSRGRIEQIVKVAKALRGNAYAPYAVKSLVEGVMGSQPQSSKVAKLDTTKLPSDFTSRLEFAQQNGFKWNQNNRIPSKSTKQLEVLEEWENQFCEVENMTMEQVLDKAYIAKVGAGAVAGALMLLERELGALLPERKTLSVFNCYQRAVKLYGEKLAEAEAIPHSAFDVKNLVLAAFYHLPIEDTEDIEKRFKTKALSTVEQVISAIKKTVSKSILPVFVRWSEDDKSDTEKLYSLQSGAYDQQLESFVIRFFVT